MALSPRVAAIIAQESKPGLVHTLFGTVYGHQLASFEPSWPPAAPFPLLSQHLFPQPVEARHQPAPPPQHRPLTPLPEVSVQSKAHPLSNPCLSLVTQPSLLALAAQLPFVAGWRRVLAEMIDLMIYSLLYTIVRDHVVCISLLP